MADGWVDVESLRTILDSTQRNGSAPTRRAIRDAERGCASRPEAEYVDALVGGGRPFLVNPQLLLHGKLIGSPDVYLPGTGLGGEVESQERHGSATDVETTWDRHERFAAAGLELVHLSVRRLRQDVDGAARDLLQRVDQRLAGPNAEPPGLVVIPKGPLLR